MTAPPRVPFETEFDEISTSPLEFLLYRGVPGTLNYMPHVVVEWHRDLDAPVETHKVFLFGFDITEQLSDELKADLVKAIEKKEMGR